MTRTVLNALEGYEWIEFPQEWRCVGSELTISGKTSKGKIVEVMFDTDT